MVRTSRSRHLSRLTHLSVHHRAGLLSHAFVHLSRTVHAEHFLQLAGIQDFLEGIVILLLGVEHLLTHFEALFNFLLNLRVGTFARFHLFTFRSRTAILQCSQILFVEGSELSQLAVVQHQLFSHAGSLHVHPLFRCHFSTVFFSCLCLTCFLWSVLRHHAATSQACSENQSRE